jgi:hypothetical protein
MRNRHTSLRIESLEPRRNPSGFGTLSFGIVSSPIADIAVEITLIRTEQRTPDSTTASDKLRSTSTAMQRDVVDATFAQAEMSMPMWGMPPMDDAVMGAETTLETPDIFPNLSRFALKRSSMGRISTPMRRAAMAPAMTTGSAEPMNVPQEMIAPNGHEDIRLRSWQRDEIDAALMEMYDEEGAPGRKTEQAEKRDEGSSDKTPEENRNVETDPFVDPEAPSLDVPLKPELYEQLTPQGRADDERSPMDTAPSDTSFSATTSQQGLALSTSVQSRKARRVGETSYRPHYLTALFFFVARKLSISTKNEKPIAK